jgi:Cysteine-rich CWC
MSSGKLAGIVETGGREPETCEACGNPFNCGATLRGCWCTEVELSERLREQLRARYQHCLCRECLERLVVADGEERGESDSLPAR